MNNPPAPAQTGPPDTRPWWRRPMTVLRVLIACTGVGLAFAAGPALRAANDADSVQAAGLWGLLPIVFFAILVLSGVRILPATLVTLVAVLALDVPSPSEAGSIAVDSLINLVTLIGLAIALGAALGAVLRETGVAQVIVTAVLSAVRGRGTRTVTLGIMVSCAVLVVALGTLAGALAVAAPLLIPVAARLGYTRGATAVMLFIGGCAGLAVAPFAGSNIAIMTAADVGYGQYLLVGGGPIAVLSLVIGVFWTPLIQRRGAAAGDFYTDEEAVDTAAEIPSAARRSTAIFVGVLLVLIVAAAIADVGVVFPLIALPVLTVVVGVVARLGFREWCSAVSGGIASMAGVWLLFWLLAVAFLLLDRLDSFGTVVDLLDPHLQSQSAFVLCLIIGLVGWVGLPGASAVQVVLLHELFGPLAEQHGIGASAWVIVLLFASKADTYGPFPTTNMLVPMGLARSTDLRMMLVTGWAVLVPAVLMYTGLVYLYTA